MKGSYKVGQREINMKKQYSKNNMKKRGIIIVIVVVIAYVLRLREAKALLKENGFTYDKKNKKYRKENASILEESDMKYKLSKIGFKWNLISFAAEWILFTVFRCHKLYE